MKTFIGAIALTFAVPAFAQAAPAADPHAGHAQHQAAPQEGQQPKGQAQHSMQDMHKHCTEMMKHHGKDHGVKSGKAPAADAHKGHSGHAQ